ncbi:winged helix-turn-helix transcriptional regulator [Actinomadura craniellae]|uniref:winged helix-turn-helix transcriptional regulator n=1 Tax=Actinomadura craniellae TaxID=2231787 RepID=UPI001314F780|nr:helix-turn-helix domain-containing protein [Actinomadura craniellae]
MAEERRPSAIGQALLAIGDQWTLLILQRAFLLHVRRFGDWRDELGMSESVLAGRLKELVAGGLLSPSPYREGGRTRTEYLLTERALELWSLLVEIWSWEQRWVPRRVGLPELMHDGCGNRTDVELGCASCGEAPVSARDTDTRRSEDTFARVAVPRHHRRTVRSDDGDPLSYLPETFELLGDRWSTVILAAALLGLRRFAEFEAELGVAPSVLSSRLRRFTELGVLATDESGGGRPAYRLTEKGRSFFGVFTLAIDWAQRWYAAPPGTDLIITHRTCGKTFRPQLRCRACGDPLARTDVHFILTDRRLPHPRPGDARERVPDGPGADEAEPAGGSR